MKTCSICGVRKALDEFPFRSDRPTVRFGMCRDCKRRYGRAHYTANIQYYKDKAARSRTRSRNDNYQELIAYLRVHPCVDCGERDVRVLQFDHVDPATKSHDVSWMMRRTAWSRVLDEIAKCEVRCANCHRRKTARERRVRPERIRTNDLRDIVLAYVA